MKTKPSLLTTGILTAAIGKGFGQPIIATQPRSQTNVAGTEATFSVAATGTPVLVPPSITKQPTNQSASLGANGRWGSSSIGPVPASRRTMNLKT